MPWRPLPQIAFAIAIYPFQPSWPDDLPLELGDELYIIEQSGADGAWLRGYLVAPPSLLAGLSSVKGQTLEARVFSGIFPRNCVEIREVLGGVNSAARYLDGEDAREHEENNLSISSILERSTGHLVNGAAHATQGGDSTTADVGKDKPRLANGIKGDIAKKRQSEGGRPDSLGTAAVARSVSRQKSGRHRDKTLQRGHSNRSLQSERSRASPIPLSPLSQQHRDADAPKPQAPVPMLKIGDETPTSLQEPLVDEIASCLREWHSTHLHELLLTQQYGSLNTLSRLIRKLDFARRQLLHNVLTEPELVSLRENVVWDLVNGNKLLGGDVVVRDPAQRGRILTGDDSVLNLSELQSTMSLLGERPVPPPDVPALQHLLVHARAIVGFSADHSTLVFYMCSKSEAGAPMPISEAYAVEVANHGSLNDIRHLESSRTLFTNLGSRDGIDSIKNDSELYLVVKLQRTEILARPSAVAPSNARPPSREGSLTSRYAFGLKSSFSEQTNSVRSGRRSMMWAQRGPAMSYWSRHNQQSSRPRSNKGERPSDGIYRSGSSNGDILSASHRAASDAGTEVLSVPVSRTIGVGVLPLADFLKQESEAEHVVQIWTPSDGSDTKPESAKVWPGIVSELLDSDASRLVYSAAAEKIHVHLRSFIAPDVDALIKMTPTSLYNITRTDTMGFSATPTQSRSDIYLTLVQPFLPPQALLSDSQSGSIVLPSHVDFSNLLLTLEVRNAFGDTIEGCIYPTSNTSALTIWQSPAVATGESWNQAIKLVLGADMVRHCHVVMKLSNAPYEPFAIAWMPLWDQESLLRDGLHSAILYKYNEGTSVATSSSSGGGYFSLPWNGREKTETSRPDISSTPKATIRLRSYLCSTSLSQDQIVLGLITWRDRPLEELVQLLKMVAFVPEIEIVKLLREVLDALFSILVQHNGNEVFEDLIFQALVTVLAIVSDRRFNVGPMVDQYAKTSFNYPFGAPSLIRSFTRLLISHTESESARKLRATFKVAHHIFDFIVRARQLQNDKEAGVGIATIQSNFVKELQPVFNTLDSLMRNPALILVGSQTLAVQHFHQWIPVLARIIPVKDTVAVTITFIDSCVDVKGKLILYRLLLINNCSRLNFFSDLDARRTLTTNTVRWLEPYLGTTTEVNDQWRDQVRLCCSVLSSQLNDLEQHEISQYVPKIVNSYLTLASAPRVKKHSFSLLFPRTYPFLNKAVTEEVYFNEALIELSAILTATLNLPKNVQLSVPSAELSDFLSGLLKVHMSLLCCEAFPSTWISLHILHHLSSMKTLEYVASVLVESYVPPPDDAESFNTDLWRAFFTTLLTLVASDALALETFPEQKRRAVWKIAGDVREQGADLLRRSWDAIGWEISLGERQQYGLERMGGYQVQYVPGLVSPIIKLCLSVHEGLRLVAVKVLQTMIASEWTLSQDLSVLQTEMIDSLDQAFKSRHVTESAGQKLFITELVHLFKPVSTVSTEPLLSALQILLDTADHFIDLLVAVQSTDSIGEASHIMYTLQLMEFLKDMQKEDIFIRYVHQLARIQTQTRNFAEAGLALRYHADLYDWDPVKEVRALHDPEFPAQSAFDRKERLYFEIIKHYEEGKSWHLALATYQELADQYRHNVLDFARLARTLRAMASIYEAIAKGDRYAPRYFRVCFKGLGFSATLRDKHFIYEGSPSEKVSGFADRMQKLHPSAQLISGNEPEDVEGQFMQISAVSVYRDLHHPVFQRVKVPQSTREHLVTAAARKFASSSRRTAPAPGSTQQVIERTVYITAEEFPTVLKRSEVVAIDEMVLSPVHAAVERTHRKTQELVALEQRVVKNTEPPPSALLEALHLSVDPSSDTSIARYRAMLPYDNEEPEDPHGIMHEEILLDPLQNALKVALIDHALVVKRCLVWLTNLGGLQDPERLMDLIQSESRSTGCFGKVS